jgi:hypothetical protein
VQTSLRCSTSRHEPLLKARHGVLDADRAAGHPSVRPTCATRCMLQVDWDARLRLYASPGNHTHRNLFEPPCEPHNDGGDVRAAADEGDSMRGKRLSAGGSYVPHRALQPPRRAPPRRARQKLNWKLNRDAKSTGSSRREWPPPRLPESSLRRGPCAPRSTLPPRPLPPPPPPPVRYLNQGTTTLTAGARPRPLVADTLRLSVDQQAASRAMSTTSGRKSKPQLRPPRP